MAADVADWQSTMGILTKPSFWALIISVLVIVPSSNAEPVTFGGTGSGDLGTPTGEDPVFSFTFHSGTGISGTGFLNTIEMSTGVFWATSGSGTITDGSGTRTIDLIPSGPGFTPSPTGAFDVDNVLTPGAGPMLDNLGLLFFDAGTNTEINIWGNTGTDYSFYEWQNSNYNVVVNTGATFEVTAVPLPSIAMSCPILLGGFGLFRRLRRHQV